MPGTNAVRWLLLIAFCAIPCSCASAPEAVSTEGTVTRGAEPVFEWRRATGSEDEVLEESEMGTLRTPSEIRAEGLLTGVATGSTDGVTTLTRYWIAAPATAPLDPEAIADRRSSYEIPLQLDTVEAIVARVVDPNARVVLEGETGADDEVLDFLVRLTDEALDLEPEDWQSIDDLVADLRIEGAEEMRAARQVLVERRFQRVLDAQLPIIAELTDRNAIEVSEQFVLGNGLLVRMRRDAIESLAIEPSVAFIQRDLPLELGAIDGVNAIFAAQMDQFVYASTLGRRPNPTRHSFPHIALGVIDIAFEDDFESITDARVAQRWNCVSNPCVSVADLNAPLINGAPPLIQNTRHGTVCAHIAGGYSPTWGLSRAGGSQESSFVLMVSNTDAAYVRAANRFALSNVDVVSSSLFDTNSTACTATLSMGAAAVNQAALINGVAWISAAGNEFHSAPITCTVRSPSSAVGAYAVGALLESADITSSTSNYSTIQSGLIAGYSSRGGLPYLGGTRSIIGTSAVGGQAYTPIDVAGVPGWATSGPGTSFAAPLIAGAAVDLRDWWLGHLMPTFTASFVNNVGFLYTSLDLMGDRMTEWGSPALTGRDSLYGSGRLSRACV